VKGYCTVYNSVDLKVIVETTKPSDKSTKHEKFSLEKHIDIGCVARM
jgi:hypothetical protein